MSTIANITERKQANIMYSLNERAQHLKVLPKVSNKNLIKPSNPAINPQKIQRQRNTHQDYTIKKIQIEGNCKSKRLDSLIFFDRQIIRKRKG